MVEHPGVLVASHGRAPAGSATDAADAADARQEGCLGRVPPVSAVLRATGYGDGVSAPATTLSATRQAAGFGRRLAALAIDWALSILVALLLFRQATYGSAESSVATLCVFAAEVVVLTWLTGASFGQRVLGLSVVRTDGSRLGLGRVALRTLLLCLVIPAVVYDSDGRGLHDRAVGSIVVRQTAETPQMVETDRTKVN